jgi:hypothetical protein
MIHADFRAASLNSERVSDVLTLLPWLVIVILRVHDAVAR